MRYGISGVNSRCSGLSQAGPFCRRHDPADLKKTDMGKNEVIYNGESVKISGTDNPDEVLVRFTDSITAFNKIKKASIAGKGRLNAAIAAMIFGILEKNGIRTHFLSRVSEDGLLCRRVEIIPIEVIVRNVIAGSMAARLGLREGMVPASPVYDLCYKNSDLCDPLINDCHAVALGLVDEDELKTECRDTSGGFQDRVRAAPVRRNCACRRDNSGQCPFLGCGDGGEIRQGQVPQGFGQGRGRIQDNI